jgi:hypothetical protein
VRSYTKLAGEVVYLYEDWGRNDKQPAESFE